MSPVKSTKLKFPYLCFWETQTALLEWLMTVEKIRSLGYLTCHMTKTAIFIFGKIMFEEIVMLALLHSTVFKEPLFRCYNSSFLQFVDFLNTCVCQFCYLHTSYVFCLIPYLLWASLILPVFSIFRIIQVRLQRTK